MNEMTLLFMGVAIGIIGYGLFDQYFLLPKRTNKYLAEQRENNEQNN